MATGADVFRVTPEGKYVHNNEEVSKDTFNQRKAASDAAMKQMRGPDRSKMSPKDRAKAAMSELEAEKEYKKGGMVKKTAIKPSKTRVKAPVSVKPRSKTIKKR
jgi:hypothetical protein